MRPYKALQDRATLLSKELAKRDVEGKRTTPSESSPNEKTPTALSTLPDQVEQSERSDQATQDRFVHIEEHLMEMQNGKSTL